MSDAADIVKATYLASLLRDYTWHPPAIRALLPMPGRSPDPPRLAIAYCDPDGDLVSAWLRVTHEDAGETVYDQEDYTVERWTCQDDGTGTATLPLSFAPQPHRLYTFEVELEDAQHLMVTSSLQAMVPSASPPSSSQGPPGAQGSPETKPGVRASEVVLWALLGIGTAFLVSAVVILLRRLSRRSASR